ncbi:MAG: hypothetical protein R2875_01310 [Desulfobacterales bacterium]
MPVEAFIYFNQCWSMQSIGVPKTDSHHIGAYYTGKFGIMELFLEGCISCSCADETGLSKLSWKKTMTSQHMHFPGIWPFKLDEAVGFGVKPDVKVSRASTR